MATISARWRKLTEAESLRRSSHVLLVLSDVVYVFGGELRPREPRDNEVYVVEIGGGKGIIEFLYSSRMKTSWITSNPTRHNQHLQPHENTLCHSSSAFSSSRSHGNIPPRKNLPLRRPWWRSYDRPRRIHPRLVLGL